MISEPDVAVLIKSRMLEIGKPENHSFYQGELTHLFIDCAWVMVSVDGLKKSAIYPPHRKFSVVLEEFITPSLA